MLLTNRNEGCHCHNFVKEEKLYNSVKFHYFVNLGKVNGALWLSYFYTFSVLHIHQKDSSVCVFCSLCFLYKIQQQNTEFKNPKYYCLPNASPSCNQ